MAIKKGIDISKWQGNADFNAIKHSGVEFIIMRAGYGRDVSQRDEKFETYYAACKKHEIPCGVYWFSYARTPEDAEREAAACLEVIKDKQFEYPIYFDMENSVTVNLANLGKAQCTAIAKAFLDKVEKAGYWVGLYMSKSPLESFISEEVRQRYAVWVAHYTDKTTYSGQFGMWQYSDTGKIPGIIGNVDLDLCYVDYPTEIKKAGLNGYKKEEVKEDKKQEKPKEPEYREYTVRAGDTLWAIAVRFLGNGFRYSEIMAASGLKSDLIYPGQILKIPKIDK